MSTAASFDGVIAAWVPVARAGDTSRLVSLGGLRTAGGGFGEGVRLPLRSAERRGNLGIGFVADALPEECKAGKDMEAGIFV